MKAELHNERCNTWNVKRSPCVEGHTLHFGDIRIDLDAYRVTRARHYVHLGPTEYRLLCFLLEHPCRVHRREELIAAVWDSGVEIQLRAVDTHIFRLRHALTAHGEIDPIMTVRSAGYMLWTARSVDLESNGSQ